MAENATKAVIFDGGLGTRISEKTSLWPKPMIEIGGKRKFFIASKK